MMSAVKSSQSKTIYSKHKNYSKYRVTDFSKYCVVFVSLFNANFIVLIFTIFFFIIDDIYHKIEINVFSALK